MKRALTAVSILMAVFLLSIETASADPHCKQCPYSCDDLGLGHKDCSVLSTSRGLCCLDLTQKGLKLAKEQERALGSQSSSPTNDHCPAGFQPSNQRCSPDERRRGCKDLRTPSGLGCVRR